MLKSLAINTQEHGEKIMPIQIDEKMAISLDYYGNPDSAKFEVSDQLPENAVHTGPLGTPVLSITAIQTILDKPSTKAELLNKLNESITS